MGSLGNIKGSESAQKNAGVEERIAVRSKETAVTEAARMIAAAEDNTRADTTTASPRHKAGGISGFGMFMIASGVSAAAAIGFVVIKGLLHV